MREMRRRREILTPHDNYCNIPGRERQCSSEISPNIMLVFLFGNACTNTHVCLAMARAVCGVVIVIIRSSVIWVTSTPRNEIFSREKIITRVSFPTVWLWTSFIFIVYSSRPGVCKLVRILVYCSLGKTTVTFFRWRGVRKLHELSAICADGRRFLCFSFLVQRDTKEGNFFRAHTLCLPAGIQQAGSAFVCTAWFIVGGVFFSIRK